MASKTLAVRTETSHVITETVVWLQNGYYWEYVGYRLVSDRWPLRSLSTVYIACNCSPVVTQCLVSKTMFWLVRQVSVALRPAFSVWK